MSQKDTELRSEIEKRRTFAIISHPDAGKTTLTEKLLLYSGMVRTAGMVRGRKTGKKASSDWMGMEQERGISITASAMQFQYKHAIINVLDTPGHQDFSEDTYRTLTAADSAIMVLDAAKGVEGQTRKLFEVCAMRGIPVLTFINKMDLPGQDPFDLVAEVEEVLGIDACPHNWPIGSGRDFKGVAECDSGNVFSFSKASKGGASKAELEVLSIKDAISSEAISEEEAETLSYELELLKEAGNTFNRDLFLKGKQTKVFFGSALTNFGLDPFFDAFIDIAPHPGSRLADKEEEEIVVSPEDPFSGFVFKIQSNMDPKHRDSMAFLRVCSGKFSRDESFTHVRTGKDVRLSRTHKMFAGDRETIDTAYPGDVIGVINPGVFAIGDTVSLSGNFTFKPLPQFSPEVVARIRPKSVMRRKAFDKGIEQLSQEGAVQVLFPLDASSSEPLIAAVGRLQFEVLQFRLTHDYQVETLIEELPFSSGVWLVGDKSTFKKHSRSLMAEDRFGRVAILFRSDHERQHSLEQNPGHSFSHFVQ